MARRNIYTCIFSIFNFVFRLSLPSSLFHCQLEPSSLSRSLLSLSRERESSHYFYGVGTILFRQLALQGNDLDSYF